MSAAEFSTLSGVRDRKPRSFLRCVDNREQAQVPQLGGKASKGATPRFWSLMTYMSERYQQGMWGLLALPRGSNPSFRLKI